VPHGSGTGCPDADGGRHYFARLGDHVCRYEVEPFISTKED
jgi:hypothetical protein